MVNASLRVASRQAAEHVRLKSTFNRRKASPGSLKDDTKHRIVKSKGGRILRLSWTKKYAPYIEHGTRAHPIKANAKPFLHFYSPKFGWRKPKSVNHPGTRPYRFGSSAARSAHLVLGQHLQRGMDSIAQKF
jgi:hypothetical protein